jgi:hypothetical protein
LRASLEIIDGEVDLGYRHWREAAERALADGDAATAASILNDMGSNQTAFGTLAGAIAACDEAVAIIEERGLDQMFVRSVRTATLMSLGRWDEVVAETPGWIQVADDMGNVLRASGLWVTLAQVLFDRGRPDLIDQDRFEPADFPRRSDPRPWAIHLRLQALRGDVDLDVVSESIEARQLWRSPSLMAVLIELGAVGLAERYRELFNGSITAETWAEGLLRIGRGEWPQADAALGATLDGQRAVGSKYSEADLLTWLGRSAIGLGVQELARERLTGARELWVSMGAAARIAEVDDLLDAI